MRLPLGLLTTSLFALAGCSASPTPVAAEPAIPAAEPVGGGMTCNPEKLNAFVGQTATKEVVNKAVNDSGSRHARVAKPGMAMTMDFRQDRLTITVDENNRIEQISCG